MKNFKLYLYFGLFLVLLVGSTRLIINPSANNISPSTNEISTSSNEISQPISVVSTSSNKVLDREVEHLVRAYPEFLLVDSNFSNAIIWKKDNSHMRFDDGVLDKDFEKMLSEPDLQDQMEMLYEPGENFTIRKNYDPGRIRFEPFFKKMYGATEMEVNANLETIYWLPSISNQPLLITRVNGVSQKLQAISNELDKLVQQPDHKYLLKYLENPGGTFNWRNIVDTNRLSTHSFGIAIDINSSYSDYWEWSTEGEKEYRNQIPLEIVTLFEKYGFIWGGKWYHYDTMHFEYRPELIVVQE